MLILFLSAYVVFSLLYGYAQPQNPELNEYLQYGDTVSCVFFLADALLRWLCGSRQNCILEIRLDRRFIEHSECRAAEMGTRFPRAEDNSRRQGGTRHDAPFGIFL